MKSVRDFKGLTARFAAVKPLRRVALVCPDDESTEAVVDRCLKEKLAEFRLITTGEPTPFIKDLCDRYPQAATIHRVDDGPDAAAALGVAMINNGEADVLMKGSINTDNLLRAVLDKENGLLPAGNVLSHITVADIPSYHKLLMISDVAVIPFPTLDQFDAMIRYDIAMCRRLGITCPKVALIHFTEKVNRKFQNTLDYVEILHRAEEGAYGECEIGGPMDVKTACDAHSAEMKHIASGIAGDTDIVIMPDLAAGNTLYKSLSCFAGATMAGVLSGTKAPVVVPSRADTADSKFYSLALACIAVD
ncbi:MAG: phosphate butyryltransferase [Paramuribaculum sp.]|nr:phosphate butyryltransferase [Paramuribaculum sp.]